MSENQARAFSTDNKEKQNLKNIKDKSQKQQEDSEKSCLFYQPPKSYSTMATSDFGDLIPHRHTPWEIDTPHVMMTTTEMIPITDYHVAPAIAHIKYELAKFQEKYLKDGVTKMLRRTIENLPPYEASVRRIHYKEFFNEEDVWWPEGNSSHVFSMTIQYPNHTKGWYLKRSKAKFVKHSDRTVSFSLEYTIHNRDLWFDGPRVDAEDVLYQLWSPISEKSVGNAPPFEKMGKSNPTNLDVEEFLEKLLNSPYLPKLQGGWLNFLSEDTDKTMRNMADHYAMLADDLSDVLPDASNTVHSAHRLLSKIEKIVDQNEDLPERLRVAIDKVNNFSVTDAVLSSGVLEVLNIVAVISTGAYLLFSDDENAPYYFFIASAITVVSNSQLMEILKEIVNLVTTNAAKMFSAPREQGSSTFDVMEGLTSILFMTACGTGGSFKDFMKTISSFSFDRVKSNLAGLFKTFADIAIRLAEGVGLSGMIPDSFKLLYIENQEIREFALETDNLHDKLKEGSFLLNDANYDYVKRLLYMGEQFVVKYSTVRQAVGYMAIIRDRLTLLRKLREQFVCSNYATDGRRPVPVVICLAGQPNTLKSQTVEHLCYGIAAKTMNAKELERFKLNTKDYIYYVPMENGFWDGYKPTHMFCVFQDFMQKVDVAGTSDSEVLKMMNSVEENGFMLHMAALEQKGSTFFNSKYIILTTNREQFQPNSIIEPAALTRRFTYWLRVKPQYQYDAGVVSNGVPTGKVAYDSLPKGDLGVPSVNPKFLNFQVKNANGADSEIVLSFDDLVTSAVDTYAEHSKWFRQKSKELQETAERMRPREQGGKFDLSRLKKSLPIAMHEIDYDFEKIGVMKNSDILDNINQAIVEQTGESTIWFQKWLSNGCAAFSLPDCPNSLACFLLEVSPTSFLECIEQGDFGLDFPMDKFGVFKRDVRLADFVPSVRLKSENGWTFLEVPTRHEMLNGKVTAFFWKIVDFSKWYALFGSIAVSGVILMTQAWQSRVRKKVATVRQEFDNNYIFDGKLLDPQLPNISEADLSARRISWYAPCYDESCPHFLYNYLYKDGGKFVVKFFKFDGWLDHHNIFNPENSTTFDGTMPFEQFNIVFPQSLSTETGSRFSKVSSRASVPHKAVAKSRVVKDQWRARHQAASVGDPNALPLIESIMNRNAYFLHIVDEERKRDKCIGMVLAVVDTWILMPKHFVRNHAMEVKRAEEEGVVFQLRHTHGSCETAWVIPFAVIATPSEFHIPNAHADIIFVRLPRHLFKLHRQIDKYFLSKEELFVKKQIDYWLVGCHGSYVNSYTGKAVYLPKLKVLDAKENHVTYDDVLQYEAATREGDCGAILVVLNPRNPAKIGGIHTAGFGGALGYASLVYREMFEPLLSNPDTVKEQMNADPFWSDRMESCFEPLCLVDKGVRVHDTSAVKPSDLSGAWPCEQMGPGVLTNNAYEKARARYARESILLPTGDLKTVVRTLFEYYENVSTYDVQRNLLSFEEAAEGLPDDPDYKPISRKTSCGYPISIHDDPRMRSKASYFGSDGPFVYTPKARALEDELREIVDKAKQGFRTQFVYTDNLKDERVSVVKILNEKTRLFSGVPLAYLLLVRMYFGKFMLWIAKNRISNSSAIGINAYEIEWAIMFRHLVGQNGVDDVCFFAGDFKGFDQSGKPTIYLMILDEINAWYDDSLENQRIRRVLWLELIQSKHIRGRLIYEWSRSLPSGHPMTTIVNTIYNHIAYRYCFFRIVGHNTYMLSNFTDYVRLMSFGDDVVGTVVEALREDFNEMTIAPYMEEIGLVYTTDLKESAEVPLRTYQQVTFLKRSFMFCPETDKLLAPLNLQVVLNIPMWTKRGADDGAITRDNVCTALRELSLWGRVIYNQHAPVIIKACKERLEWVPPHTSFESSFDLVVHFSYGFTP